MFIYLTFKQYIAFNNASLTRPLNNGVHDSRHACVLMADNFNTCCNIMNYIRIQTSMFIELNETQIKYSINYMYNIINYSV